MSISFRLDFYIRQQVPYSYYPPTATLLLVGDIDQLPSVGPGDMLKDIIASGRVETVRLTEGI